MLHKSCRTGNASSVRALLHLPAPPDADGAEGTSLTLTVHEGPHLAALEALLECGANPCIEDFQAFHLAGSNPRRAAALPLLLQFCPAPLLKQALTEALHVAVVAPHNQAVLTYLLPLADSAGVDLFVGAGMAVERGVLGALQQLLDLRCAPNNLADLILLAAGRGRVGCLEALLDRAGPPAPLALQNTLTWAMLAATGTGGVVLEPEGGRAAVALLLRRGALATLQMRVLAAAVGDDALLALLHAAVPAPLAPAVVVG